MVVESEADGGRGVHQRRVNRNDTLHAKRTLSEVGAAAASSVQSRVQDDSEMPYAKKHQALWPMVQTNVAESERS